MPYTSYYSLKTEPFSKEIPVKNLYVSSNMKEAQSRLRYLNKARGYGLLIGDTGCGKTTSLRIYAHGLDSSRYKIIYYPLSTGTVMDFYRGLVMGLGEEPAHRKVDLFSQIQSSIKELYYQKGMTPVFILDEMHLAPNKFLKDMGILFNFSMDSEKPFIVTISGLPFLKNRLNLNQNTSLDQRIIIRYSIEPLSHDEVKEYIEHLLKVAGANHPIFSPAAYEAIASCSRGIPRIINNLATYALLAGANQKADTINEDIVYQAFEEIEMNDSAFKNFG